MKQVSRLWEQTKLRWITQPGIAIVKNLQSQKLFVYEPMKKYPKVIMTNKRITKSNGLEMTISEEWWSKAVINGQPLFNFENNGDEKTDR